MCTPRQKRFIDEYLIDLNASAAYRRSGYVSKSPDVEAARLLVKPSIQAAIAKRQAKIADKLEITQERVAAEYAKIAFSDMRKFSTWGPSGVHLLPSDALDPADAACVAEVSQSVTAEGGTIKFKLHDKKGALDSICKMLGFNAPEKNINLDVTNLTPEERQARIDELIAKRGS